MDVFLLSVWFWLQQSSFLQVNIRTELLVLSGIRINLQVYVNRKRTFGLMWICRQSEGSLIRTRLVFLHTDLRTIRSMNCHRLRIMHGSWTRGLEVWFWNLPTNSLAISIFQIRPYLHIFAILFIVLPVVCQVIHHDHSPVLI